MESQFSVEARTESRAVVIAVSGELDLASAPALDAELDSATSSGCAVVIVDLRQLEFMDSTGLSILVKAHQRAVDDGRELVLVKGPQQVQRLLDLTGVAERLTLVDSPEEWLADGD